MTRAIVAFIELYAINILGEPNMVAITPKRGAITVIAGKINMYERPKVQIEENGFIMCIRKISERMSSKERTIEYIKNSMLRLPEGGDPWNLNMSTNAE